jgi:hypothetical protein
VTYIKKRGVLDRSRPPIELLHEDPADYNRRYMRWYRDTKKQGKELPPKPKHKGKRKCRAGVQWGPKPRTDLDRSKPPRSLYKIDRREYHRRYDRWRAQQRKGVKNNV